MLFVFQRKTDARRSQGAFTLAELLVVVAVTAVLASLLLPALSGAKEKSRRAVCQNNMHQFLYAISMYANDHSENLPSSADNYGYYNSICLSDFTYTNFVTDYLDGGSAVMYCPNIDYDGITNHGKSGYLIGYNYLSTAIVTTGKGPDYWVGITKLTGPGTNELLADANYWSSQAIGDSGSSIQMAPHTSMGSAMNSMSTAARTSSATAPPTSKSLGSKGGNIGRADMSVTWKAIENMGQYPASNLSDAEGNW
jgi:prepilin-type N-terminal cleavage/methylation domain-containing protein